MTAFVGKERSAVYTADELISVDTYREYVVRALPRPEPMELRTADSLGLVTTQDVVSSEALPSFANSAMDGYAVRAIDVAGAREDAPVTLTVVGEIVAGQAPASTIGEGQAIRIMTGAPVPPGADAIVPVEVTGEDGGSVRVHRGSTAGQYVRPVGQDIRPGDVLVRRGTTIEPGHIAALIAAGVERVHCFPAPRVTVLSTGDELVRAGEHPGPGQLRDSNGPMLAAMVRRAGGQPHLGGPVRDDRMSLTDALHLNVSTSDVVLMTGGVSAGVRDLVADVVSALGEAARFKVAMQPGMPQVIGKIDDVPIIGLPGNPVSAFVSFEVFVRPALRLLAGRRDLTRPAVTARLGGAVSSPEHKRSYLRARMVRDGASWIAEPTGHQGSHVISSVAAADALLEIPEGTTSLAAGDPVTAHLLVES